MNEVPTANWLIRGWIQVGEEVRLIEFDITKHVEFEAIDGDGLINDQKVTIPSYQKMLEDVMFNGKWNTIWVKEDQRDTFVMTLI